MADIKWIKITTNIFNDEKIQLIESMPDSDTLLVIWFKLLALAGKSNSGGLVMFNENVPYTIEMLITLFRRKESVISLALQTFEKFQMIEILDNDAILITNWEKHQNIDKMEEIREQTRLRVAAHRERLRLTNDNVTLQKRYSNTKVTQQNKNKKENKDKEKEKDIKDIVEDKSSMSVDTDDVKVKTSKINYSSIADYWNTHSFLKEITVVTDKRKGLLNGRIKEHGLEAIFKAIDNVGKSPFLKGENKQSWIANFDWVFRPNNFIKVLEGNYLDAESKSSHTLESDIERRMRLINERLEKEDDARTSFSN